MWDTKWLKEVAEKMQKQGKRALIMDVDGMEEVSVKNNQVVIDKLKEDLSNSLHSFSLSTASKLRGIHKKDNETVDEFLDRLLTEEEKEHIIRGYATIKSDTYYCTVPNYFQRYGLKERFDVDVIY